MQQEQQPTDMDRAGQQAARHNRQDFILRTVNVCVDL
jgi:hypothetical protein